MEGGMNKAHYGFDAPGIMWGFLLFGIPATIAGFVLPHMTDLTVLKTAGYLLVAVGIVVALLGASMFFYGVYGKFKMRDFMLDKVQWKGNEMVLDVGTGRGLFMVGAAKRLTTGRSIGIDIWNQQDLSGNTVENAYRNAAIENVREKVEVKNEDARMMGFADNTFDVVYSMFCLHNIETNEGQEKACREIARVLKPNGIALIGDYIPTHHYARYFEKAGLKVKSSKNYSRKVFAMMWMVEATK